MNTLNHASNAVAMCRALARCSEVPGKTTRTFLSPPMHDVHATLSEWMARAGMRTRVDSVGNLHGVYPSAASGAPTLYIGSHLDTVPNAGAFDGILGVTIGVALVESLGRQRLPFHIEVVGFSEEEGVRFGFPFIGSRAFCGTLDETTLDRVDNAGRSVKDAIREFGRNPENLADARADTALGYLEFHIEQGPVLERLGVPVACVNVIVGQTRGAMTFTGRAAHVGTTPMHDRHDALAGAAEWIVAIEQEARLTSGLAATVGRLEVEPGAANVIAGRCRASLDVRHEDDVRRENAMGVLQERARTIAIRRGLTVRWDETLDQNAVPLHTDLVMRLEHATRDAGFAVHRLASGAGHDAMIVASVMPAAMLFLRTLGGISHHPDEAVDVMDVSAALQVGRRFVDDLARSMA